VNVHVHDGKIVWLFGERVTSTAWLNVATTRLLFACAVVIYHVSNDHQVYAYHVL
jgi:hypothetical protein